MSSSEFIELDLDALEQVSGGKKTPYVRSLGKNVNVRSGPGKEYPVVAQLNYLDEVPASGETCRDKHGTLWARVRTLTSQNKRVTGWVSREFAEPCYN